MVVTAVPYPSQRAHFLCFEKRPAQSRPSSCEAEDVMQRNGLKPQQEGRVEEGLSDHRYCEMGTMEERKLGSLCPGT